MVRLDKILHIITCFKVGTGLLEQDQYSNPSKDIRVSKSSYLLLQRMGVVSKEYKLKFAEENIIKSIPFGREEFLLKNLETLSRIDCTEIDPNCISCILNEQCDYNNKKNDWVIN